MKELYLVTGATGHLGNTVAHRLARAGRQVRALVLPGEEHAPQLPGGVEAVAGDVRSPASLEALFAGAEGRDVTVIHCAGIVSIASRFDQNVYDVNVTGTKNVVDACVRRGVKKLVHVSSVHALPEKPGGALVSETDVFSPGAVVGLYAKTKAAATAYALAARARGLDVRVVHPSGIWCRISARAVWPRAWTAVMTLWTCATWRRGYWPAASGGGRGSAISFPAGTARCGTCWPCCTASRAAGGCG